MIPKNGLWTVSVLNEYIRQYFEKDPQMRMTAVVGELSNYTAHPSGHSYFSLKEKDSVIKAVMFKGYKPTLHFQPKNGMKVIAIGDVRVWPAAGMYQLYVQRLLPDGEGDILKGLEELKRKLEGEGLFDPARKKPLPPCPEKIAVVTASQGAALRDVRTVLGRRWPLGEVMLFPCLVQGGNAPGDIAEALSRADNSGADVILLVRGGGSAEDLWPFQTEEVVRAVAACRTPVVTGVGHETDTTLADYAADLRCPTPSAAAEQSVPHVEEIRDALRSARERLDWGTRRMTESAERDLSRTSKLLGLCMSRLLLDARHGLVKQNDALNTAMDLKLRSERETLSRQAQRLSALNPLGVLARGYSIVRKDGSILRSAAQAQPGDILDITLQDGTLRSQVVERKQDVEI